MSSPLPWSEGRDACGATWVAAWRSSVTSLRMASFSACAGGTPAESYLQNFATWGRLASTTCRRSARDHTNEDALHGACKAAETANARQRRHTPQTPLTRIVHRARQGSRRPDLQMAQHGVQGSSGFCADSRDGGVDGAHRVGHMVWQVRCVEDPLLMGTGLICQSLCLRR